ncbi:MAG TPA: DUF2550 domain-containing protein [Candidatus Brachybacterium intestinipullorum]|uniref:DUF2550 domain-containing protein n=1 Tax=Candidatus Brachybacterium intestinipullorum TaxID=2838512 RepID=A0A9D2Q1D3_9MICO|nr:DUF2550 domain-containing protein [Candidatus Brachybacterium intestinipullorum]
MTDLSIPILLVGVGMLVVVAALVLRQLLVRRSRGAFECSLQRRGIVGGERWQRGMMRFGTDRLRWFRAFSLRLGPAVVLRRGEILEVSRRRLPARLEGGQESYLLEFTLRDGREIHAIVDLVPGAALNSWLEAAPTGGVRGDAD